ncbi:MAG: formylglycine-generating enzyme family protein [Cyanobacteria bacterium P01_F01_bin.53]
MLTTLRRTPRTSQCYTEPLFAIVDAIPLQLVVVPSGNFTMGSPSDELGRYDREGPQNELAVSQFLMGRYPITQAQWQAVADLPKIKRALNPSPSRFPGDNHPVEQVSWHEASEFCDRLAQYTGRPYRLPTEAEWEYACRAGTTTPFYFGKLMSTEVANFKGTSEKNLLYTDRANNIYRQSTVAVDHFGIANRFGLSDMHGNVWEWCQELWSESHNPNQTRTKKSAVTHQSSEEYRMARGGSWYSTPERCRSASRFHFPSTVGHHDVGFRVACTYP